MRFLSTLDRFHRQLRQNRWLHYFARFCRLALAAGFLPSGAMKIMGERFTVLSDKHPMGHYLEALHQTGYYYPFIGYAQVTAAILLLIPRTATLGALLYLPIIVNICVLSLAVRFDGSLLTSPLMVLANLYLLGWDYDKLKGILPLTQPALVRTSPKPSAVVSQFPTLFFTGVIGVVVLVVMLINSYRIRPRNTLAECATQCAQSESPAACAVFCGCIHQQGKPLAVCLDEYNRALYQEQAHKLAP